MSDIYYCSNTKNKKSSSLESTHNHNSDKSSRSPDSINKANNNSSCMRDNNNVCNGKRNSIVVGKSNWNTKAVQKYVDDQVGETNGCNTSTTIVPPKIFHNTRCARHQKAHSHSTHNGCSNSSADHVHHHNSGGNHSHHIHHIRGGHRRKTESVLSTDSDIRFTRRKLGDSQKCGCAVIAAILVGLLIVGAFVYVGYTYFKPEPLPDRIFRGKFHIRNDKWTMDLADHKSQRFQSKGRDYRERINLVIRRSDLREAFERSEILALDGFEDTNDIVVHFNLIFNPYASLVSVADILALFGEEFRNSQSKFFADVTVDPESFTIREITGITDEPTTSSSRLGVTDETTEAATTTEKPQRRCEPLKLDYCRSIGYNITTYPNLLGHNSFDEVYEDVITFRELVDAECFREAFDFICRLLQPPCDLHSKEIQSSSSICREYCEQFMKGCGNRLPKKFTVYFNCESFPEATGIQSCRQKPGCANDLNSKAQSTRLCDGYPDCPDLSDERACSFCSSNSLYCGRGRACIPRRARCDGKPDCPDGTDEKDCLAIAPLALDLMKSDLLVPYLPQFNSEGYAVFFEKGQVGKLCAEGLQGEGKLMIRQTVAESLCKSLGYESVETFAVQNDTEVVDDYVRVLDPHAPEISFVRTHCPRREVLYVGCGDLQCGVQSVLSGKKYLTLPKIAAPGDWPWLVALYREDVHVCDGTLISKNWVLTTESCFQGQPRATWMAIFGSVRLASTAPWTQRRRVIGMIKSPVEGSTAALIRLETPVVFSDHVRPICLPDRLQRQEENQMQRRSFVPRAERLESRNADRYIVKRLEHETQQYFISPTLSQPHTNIVAEQESFEYPFDNVAQRHNMPKAEALTKLEDNLGNYPILESAPQVQYYGARMSSASSVSKDPNFISPQDQIWTHCNTLGWSRQRDHLQRVQLKIGEMAACENISIATVNSMCTEATFQKHDCTQEEYSGAPVQCLIPETNQWALIGVSSWRIACGPSGVERPRMYDKISSNTAWIREIMNAS
uniref:Atrial natriuretic peptide-converting enzyme n=1 Tax=Glossina morsitans morsitans TaxID=37546 RepID=A0A1B0FR42_GLOMM